MSEPSKASSQCSYVKHLAGSPGEMMLALGAWVRSAEWNYGIQRDKTFSGSGNHSPNISF